MKYWFLISKDVVKAISKDDHNLIGMAQARIDFLLKVVDPGLVQEGLKEEEDALWKIHIFLHNNGWRERANNSNIQELGLRL